MHVGLSKHTYASWILCSAYKDIGKKTEHITFIICTLLLSISPFVGIISFKKGYADTCGVKKYEKQYDQSG